MSFGSVRTRLGAVSAFRSLAMAMLLWPLAAGAEPTADAIAVNVDQAKLVKLPGRVATRTSSAAACLAFCAEESARACCCVASLVLSE